MKSPISNILHRSIKKDKYNILTFPTHERYQSNLAKTGHNFYLFHGPGIKKWNPIFGKCPDNHTLLNEIKQIDQLPDNIDFDFILCQSNGGQLNASKQLSQLLHIPIIFLEHTTTMPQWTQEWLKNLKQHTKCDINVFISDYNRDRWLFTKEESEIIHHCIDQDVFKYSDEPRRNHILTVANEYVTRDWCLGFGIYQRVTQKLPVFPVGDTPGLSKPAQSIEQLVSFYQGSRIFLNTSTHSPIPTALLEAMACGCAVVSTASCMIPEVITQGVNGFLSNDENQMRQYLERLLADEDLAKRMGEQAAKTIQERFGVDKFVNDWNMVFNKASQIVYKGVINV